MPGTELTGTQVSQIFYRVMNLKNKVVTALRWTAGARILAQLVTWAITIVVIRLLSPSDYGLMAMSMAVIALLNLLNEMGMGAAVIQKRALSDSQLRSVFSLILVVNVTLYGVLWLSAKPLAIFFSEDRLIPVIRVLGLQFILMGISIIPQSLLEKALDFKARSVVEFVAALIGSGVTLVLALQEFDVWSLVYGNLARVAVRAIGFNILRPYLKAPTLSLRGIGSIASFGGWVTIERILWYVYTEADIFIIGRALGNDLLGIYSVARHLASLPAQKLNAAITQVSLPAFSAVQGEKEQFARYFIKATRMMSIVAVPVFFGRHLCGSSRSRALAVGSTVGCVGFADPVDGAGYAPAHDRRQCSDGSESVGTARCYGD